MISFDEYVKLYHPNIVKDVELKHTRVEFDECVELISKLDKDKDYSEQDLRELLFDSKIDSQTTFYRKRRGLARIATIQGYDFRLIHKINQVSFEDVYEEKNFANEFFGSLEELYSEINKIQKLNPDHNRTGSRAATGLLWCGLTFAEITRLKNDDLDFKSKTVKVNNNRINVYEEVIKAIRDYINGQKNKGEYLFTGTNGDKAHRTTINKMISGLNGYTDKKFISKNITYSGRFYRRYKGIDNTELRGSDIKLKYNLWVKVFGK